MLARLPDDEGVDGDGWIARDTVAFGQRDPCAADDGAVGVGSGSPPNH